MSMSNIDNVSPDNIVEIQVDGHVARVERGTEVLQFYGKRWRLKWVETFPLSFAGYEQDDAPAVAGTFAVASIAEAISSAAALVADFDQLDARDRSAAIGLLRQALCLVRGGVGLPGFRQAPFAPTTPRP
jgi:hypothetical protein